ncbi:MAG: tRNA (adenosine(37)-N6)-threonylcarbamoyltransferase complex transferase subunit TsaD, partial [Candidatus Binatia bacterium]
SGGVSANSRLRRRMTAEGEQCGLRVFVPSLKLCTDNAAMIAFAGAWRLADGQRASLQLNASATLPLEETAVQTNMNLSSPNPQSAIRNPQS